MSYSNKSNVSITWNTFTSVFIFLSLISSLKKKTYSISSYHKPNRFLVRLFPKNQILTYQISIVQLLFCQESATRMIAACFLVDAIYVIQILQKETSTLMYHKGISGWISGLGNTFNVIHIFETLQRGGAYFHIEKCRTLFSWMVLIMLRMVVRDNVPNAWILGHDNSCFPTMHPTAVTSAA